MASGSHGLISLRIAARVAAYVEDNNLGFGFDSSTTYDFEEGGRKRLPDASFISTARLPKNLNGYLAVAPDLAVEVVSKNDTAYEIIEKVMQYQKAGVRSIWIVYPLGTTVDVYKLATGLKKYSFNLGETVADETVLPGFKLELANIFGPPFQQEEEKAEETDDAP